MLLRCQIAAFVEIPSNFPGGTEIREEQLQQLEREFICHIPTGSRSFAARVQRLPAARKQEPHPINSPGSEAKVEAEIRVQFDIQIPRVALCGAEEELQTAVLTRLIEHAGIFRADLRFLRVQMHIQSALVICKLRVGADRLTGPPHPLVERRFFDFIPVRLPSDLLYPILSGHNFPFFVLCVNASKGSPQASIKQSLFGRPHICSQILRFPILWCLLKCEISSFVATAA